MSRTPSPSNSYFSSNEEQDEKEYDSEDSNEEGFYDRLFDGLNTSESESNSDESEREGFDGDDEEDYENHDADLQINEEFLQREILNQISDSAGF